MKKLILSVAVLCLAPAAAHARVAVNIDIGLPAAPALVVVEPGVQVVEGFREEVFFSNGSYWCRRGDAWYRAPSPRARFVWVERRRVPAALARMPAGHYRNWHRAEMREEHREMRDHERAVREERREERREDRREQRRDERREEHRHR